MTPFDRSTSKPHCLVQKFGRILNASWVMVKFECIFQKFFVTMATGVGLTQISLAQLNRSTQKTNCLVQESWWYLLHKLRNGRFYVDICHFWLPWQQGWAYQKFGWLSLIGLPQKPPVRCKNLGPIFNASWVMVNFVLKYPNFCYHGNRGSLTQISLT